MIAWACKTAKIHQTCSFSYLDPFLFQQEKSVPICPCVRRLGPDITPSVLPNAKNLDFSMRAYSSFFRKIILLKSFHQTKLIIVSCPSAHNFCVGHHDFSNFYFVKINAKGIEMSRYSKLYYLLTFAYDFIQQYVLFSLNNLLRVPDRSIQDQILMVGHVLEAR